MCESKTFVPSFHKLRANFDKSLWCMPISNSQYCNKLLCHMGDNHNGSTINRHAALIQCKSHTQVWYSILFIYLFIFSQIFFEVEVVLDLFITNLWMSKMIGKMRKQKGKEKKKPLKTFVKVDLCCENVMHEIVIGSVWS